MDHNNEDISEKAYTIFADYMPDDKDDRLFDDQKYYVDLDDQETAENNNDQVFQI